MGITGRLCHIIWSRKSNNLPSQAKPTQTKPNQTKPQGDFNHLTLDKIRVSMNLW
jgi:hypothetical protein